MEDLLEPFAGDSASQLATVLRAEFGTLSQAMSAPGSHLLAVGKDFPKACELLLAARQLVDAASRERIAGSRIEVSDPALLQYVRTRVCGGNKERLLVFFCNDQHQYIWDEEIGWGTRDSVRIDMAQLFRRAVTLDAHQLLLAHNHPSGLCTPSEGDIRATRELSRMGQALGFEVLDHLIVTRTHAYSMRAGGML